MAQWLQLNAIQPAHSMVWGDETMLQGERVFLSLLPAGPRERRLALAVILVSLAVFLAAVPFARIPLPRVDAFIPAYQSALAINDLITAVLLFGQFSIMRTRGLLLLACGYLFTAAMVLMHMLSFPGLFAPGGLVSGGSQTTVWLYMFWHAGFPLLVIAYARSGATDSLPSPGRAMALAGGLVAAAVALVTLLATTGHDLLPVLLAGGQYTPVMIGVVGGTWALSFVALGFLCFRRTRSVLDLWLIVVMATWIFEIGLSAVLNAARFDLGFYTGRVYGLLGASFVLMVLLVETRTLYARLARSLETERQVAERRAGDLQKSEETLRLLNETLESRVAERTHRLEAEILEREKAQNALRETQKLEAVGRMTGGIAHDFNNILMVIQGNAEFLREKLGENADHRAADAIDRAVERGTRLIRQVLAFSRRQALKSERIDLCGRSAEFSGLLAPSLRGDIRLIVVLGDELWPVECDAGELELALMNLCVNARDAMPGGGLVRIAGSNLPADPDAGQSGDFVAISVTDTGTGIAPEDLPRVFEPFYTTKEIGKGTGLGLAQVHGFAEQAGGRATITSTPGQGTTVTLLLPRAVAGAGAEAAPAAPAAARAQGSVLLVEDDQDVADVAVLMLTMIGYRAQHVHDARTALALLLGGRRFDVLFSDIVMPGGMSGLELARKVRKHFPEQPVLLASGYNGPAVDVGREGFDLIAKPYRADSLADALQRARTTARARGTG